MKQIRIGTRSSKLALLQTDIVINEILAKNPHLSRSDIEILHIKTMGDKVLDKNLSDIGGKSLFTKEIEAELIKGTINFAVHSLKDFTSIIPVGLAIKAVIEREDPRDALVSYDNIKELSKILPHHIVGTSSCRRKAQLLHMNASYNISPLRGNVITRLQKLQDKQRDVAILALAGLKRLNIDQELYHPIAAETMLPAPGQGVICIEVKDGDKFAQTICESINHQDTMHVVKAERGFLEAIEGDCNIPIAALANIIEGKIELRAEVLSPEGKNKFNLDGSCSIEEGYDLGKEFGTKLKEKLSKCS